MEPPSPTQALGVNPLRANRGKSHLSSISAQNLLREPFYLFKRITKENGSIHNSTRERVDSRN